MSPFVVELAIRTLGEKTLLKRPLAIAEWPELVAVEEADFERMDTGDRLDELWPLTGETDGAQAKAGERYAEDRQDGLWVRFAPGP